MRAQPGLLGRRQSPAKPAHQIFRQQPALLLKAGLCIVRGHQGETRFLLQGLPLRGGQFEFSGNLVTPLP